MSRRDWMLRLMRHGKFLRRLMPAWHAKEKAFRDWYLKLSEGFDPSAYERWVQLLGVTEEVRGYRDVRYHTFEKAKAKAKKLLPEEYTGATFSISNLGMFGIKEFTAIINPPEAGILAVGGAAPVAVVRDGEIVVRNIMNVTMSCDHRVIDGATGAKFLQTFKQMLESPGMMSA